MHWDSGPDERHKETDGFYLSLTSFSWETITNYVKKSIIVMLVEQVENHHIYMYCMYVFKYGCMYMNLFYAECCLNLRLT